MRLLHPCRRAAVLTALSCLSAPPLPLVGPPRPALAAVELEPEQQLVVDAWAVVQRAYYDPNFNGVDWKNVRTEYVKRPYKNMKAAREGVAEMLSKLNDRFTRYVTPGGYTSLLARFEARPGDGGIGVALGSRADGAIELLSISDGSPAAAAGLRVGDVIRSVDGRKVAKSASAEDVAALIIGPTAEPLRLELARSGGADSEPLELSLTRAPLSAGAVSARVLDAPGGGTVGVLSIPQFSDGATWMSSLERGLTAVASADSLLVDLRGNPGGHFPTGVAASRYFLPADRLIVSTRDRTGSSSDLETGNAAGAYFSATRPLVLLTDRATASAAEVFAAALKDNDAATVVGVDAATFGKGLVQTIAKTSDGGAVVCSTARYVTPSGRDINKVGIKPDRRVPQADEPCAMTPAGAVECLARSGGVPPPRTAARKPEQMTYRVN